MIDISGDQGEKTQQQQEKGDRQDGEQTGTPGAPETIRSLFENTT